jgi:hypothetical protein
MRRQRRYKTQRVATGQGKGVDVAAPRATGHSAFAQSVRAIVPAFRSPMNRPIPLKNFYLRKPAVKYGPSIAITRNATNGRYQ